MNRLANYLPPDAHPPRLVELTEEDFTEEGFIHRRVMLGWGEYDDAQYDERRNRLFDRITNNHNTVEFYDLVLELVAKAKLTSTPIYDLVLCYYDLAQYGANLGTHRAYTHSLTVSEARKNALREQRARLWEIYTKQQKANWRGRFKRAEVDYQDRLKTEQEQYEKVQICEYNVSVWRKHLTA